MPQDNPSSYVLGASEHERRRLTLQGRILNPLTERFLKRAGLWAGMRILDLGCGIGDVSLIAARLVGPQGLVTGLDPDSVALDTARKRAKEENLLQLDFEQGNFESYTTDRTYDAIIGRHVLIHSADAPEWIGRMVSLLRRGGIVAFQEYDLSYFPPIEPDLPLFMELRECLVELFGKATRYPDTGARLYHWMHRAGFSNTSCYGECLMDGGPESAFYEWFAETVRSVAPQLAALGVLEASVLELPTLALRLRDEAVSAQGCLTTPLIVSCSGERS